MKKLIFTSAAAMMLFGGQAHAATLKHAGQAGYHYAPSHVVKGHTTQTHTVKAHTTKKGKHIAAHVVKGKTIKTHTVAAHWAKNKTKKK